MIFHCSSLLTLRVVALLLILCSGSLENASSTQFQNLAPRALSSAHPPESSGAVLESKIEHRFFLLLPQKKRSTFEFFVHSSSPFVFDAGPIVGAEIVLRPLSFLALSLFKRKMARALRSDKHERILRALLKLPDNRRCADCDTLVRKLERWASMFFFFCDDDDVHRARFSLPFGLSHLVGLLSFRFEGVAETSLESAAWLEWRPRPSKQPARRKRSRKRERRRPSLSSFSATSCVELNLFFFFLLLLFFFQKKKKKKPHHHQGPQYVVTNFNIFVCTVCSGVQ